MRNPILRDARKCTLLRMRNINNGLTLRSRNGVSKGETKGLSSYE